MKFNVYVVKKVSHKEGREDFTYFQMYVDLGYRKCTLTMDIPTISELIQLPINCLYDLELDKPIKFGEYSLKA